VGSPTDNPDLAAARADRALDDANASAEASEIGRGPESRAVIVDCDGRC
jgi:hypothetical protein